VLKALRIPPAPKRHADTTWRLSMRTQASTMLAVGFFHVDCVMTLKRMYCLFVLEVGSRYVHILRITTNPDGPWTTQQIRNLLMDLSDRAADFRFLVRDRAGQFPASFDAVLADARIEAVKIRPEAPVRTPTRNGCPDRGHRPDADLPANDICGRSWPSTPQRATPHRGRQLRPPRPDHPVAGLSQQRIKRRPVLGGLLNEYERAA
jgi:putative transposase